MVKNKSQPFLSLLAKIKCSTCSYQFNLTCPLSEGNILSRFLEQEDGIVASFIHSKYQPGVQYFQKRRNPLGEKITTYMRKTLPNRAAYVPLGNGGNTWDTNS